MTNDKDPFDRMRIAKAGYENIAIESPTHNSILTARPGFGDDDLRLDFSINLW